VDRLLQILELQLQIDLKKSAWNDYLLKNVIVTGRSGSGRKTIIGECCQRLWNKHIIYYKLVDCLSFKGKRQKENNFLIFLLLLGRKLDNIITSLTQTIDEMVFRQPSILILDHFDDLFPNETTITDANIILATQKLCLCK
jgi:Cdc6-like AAA superfamily ATPase